VSTLDDRPPPSPPAPGGAVFPPAAPPTPPNPPAPGGAVFPTRTPEAPPTIPPAARPPAPPRQPWGGPPSPSDRPAPSPRGRFLGGVAVGAAVGALVAGGIVAVATHDDDSNGSNATASPPAVTAPAAAPAPAATKAPSNAIAAIVQRAEPSIVAIHDSISQTDMFGQVQQGQAAGTGFVLSADGYIVTNDHVVDGASDIAVHFGDGKDVPATVVAADRTGDLAVLKASRAGLTPLPLGDSDALQIGDQVVAIGNALDLSGEPTVTTGIVSATGRSLDEPNGTHLTHLLQTDTAINPGNSGGPLLNMQGEVVGINTAIAGSAQNIGFAIAINPAKTLIDQLQTGKVPAHALLGVETQPPQSGDGAEITNMTAGSAAATAGLRVGDVITKVGADAITNPDDLASAIAGHQPGDKVTVTFQRDGATKTTPVTLGTRPTTTTGG
jgi:putative serine protease PepD